MIRDITKDRTIVDKAYIISTLIENQRDFDEIGKYIGEYAFSEEYSSYEKNAAAFANKNIYELSDFPIISKIDKLLNTDCIESIWITDEEDNRYIIFYLKSPPAHRTEWGFYYSKDNEMRPAMKSQA